VNSAPKGVIGGLAMTPPLSVEEERRLHPIIQAGRKAAVTLAKGKVTDQAKRRKLLRERQAGQDAETRLLQATCGLVRTRVMERGY
jgi:hypothetical protein